MAKLNTDKLLKEIKAEMKAEEEKCKRVCGAFLHFKGCINERVN